MSKQNQNQSSSGSSSRKSKTRVRIPLPQKPLEQSTQIQNEADMSSITRSPSSIISGAPSDILSREPSSILSHEPSSILSREPSSFMMQRFSLVEPPFEGGKEGGIPYRGLNPLLPGLFPVSPIQAKLKVGPVGDKYEHEADKVADQVMKMPSLGYGVQRQEEDDDELQMKPILNFQSSILNPRIQRITDSATLEGHGKGKWGGGFFGLGKTSWGRLITSVKEYEVAQNNNKKLVALNKIIEYSNEWLAEPTRKKNKRGDDAKKVQIETLKQESQKESTELEFNLKYSTEALNNQDTTAQVGTEFIKQTKNRGSSHTVKAIEQGTEEMYSTANMRSRQLYQVLSAINQGKVKPNEKTFETVIDLLSGGSGLVTEYQNLVMNIKPNDANAQNLKKQLEVVFGHWANTRGTPHSIDYIQNMAKTGQVDEKYSLLFNLGQVSTKKVNDTFVKDIVEKFLKTDLISKEETVGDNIAREAEIRQLEDKLNEFTQFFVDHNLPVPGRLFQGKSWRKLAPWNNVDSDQLNQIESAMAFYESVITAGELVNRGTQAEKTELTQARGDALITKTIDRLIKNIKAMRGAVRTSSEEEQGIVTFVNQWKKETTVLEKKFGLTQHTIGKRVRDGKLIPAKGLGRDTLSNVYDIVSGEVGNIYQTYGKLKKDKNAPETHDSDTLEIEQAIVLHTDRQNVTTATDIEKLANDLGSIAQSNPDSLVKYLLKLAGKNDLTPKNFYNLSETEKTKIVNDGLDALGKKLGVKKGKQFRQEKGAAMEKIVAIFKFGGDVLEEGQGYIAMRQALTEWTYRNKTMLKAAVNLSDKDRAMIRADGDLRRQMANALKNDSKDKAKIENVLGFSLVAGPTDAPTTPGATTVIGGKDVKTGKDVDVESMTISKDEHGNINYDAITSHWAGVLTNTYHTFAHDAMAKGVLKRMGRWIAKGITFGTATKSKPDTKALMMVAYEAQEAIRQAVEADATVQDKTAKVTEVIKTITAKIATVGAMKGLHARIKSWFENGTRITVGEMLEVGKGVISADEAYLTSIVEHTSPKDLLDYFADTEKFNELYMLFQAELTTINTLENNVVKSDHIKRAKDYHHQLINYTPGVKRSFVQELQQTKRVSHSTRRSIVETIQNKLAGAYAGDNDFQAKINEVRKGIAGQDTRETTKIGGTEEDVSLGSMKKDANPTEFKAMSEVIEEQTRMQNTKALRGYEGRALSGKKGAMMESRANYLGTGRSMMETRTQKDKTGEQEYDLELSSKLNKLADTRRDYDKKTSAFLAFREKVKIIVRTIVQLLVSAIVIAATAGAGSAAVIPVWLGMIITGVSKAIEKAIEFGFDPESVTLATAAFDVISHAIISGATSTIGQALGTIEGFGYNWFAATAGSRLEGASFLRKLVERVWVDAYESISEGIIKGVLSTMSEAIKGGLMKGDGTEDAKSQMESTLGLKALMRTGVLQMTQTMGSLGTAVLRDVAKYGSLEKAKEAEDSFVNTFMGFDLRSAGYQRGTGDKDWESTGGKLDAGRGAKDIWGLQGLKELDKKQWWQGVEYTVVTTTGAMVTQIATSQLEMVSKTKGKSVMGVGALESDVGSGVGTGFDVEDIEAPDVENGEIYDGVVNNATKQLRLIAKGFICTANNTLKEVHELNIELQNMSIEELHDKVIAMEEQLQVINNLQNGFDNSFTSKTMELLKQASVGDHANVQKTLSEFNAVRQQVNSIITNAGNILETKETQHKDFLEKQQLEQEQELEEIRSHKKVQEEIKKLTVRNSPSNSDDRKKKPRHPQVFSDQHGGKNVDKEKRAQLVHLAKMDKFRTLTRDRINQMSNEEINKWLKQFGAKR